VRTVQGIAVLGWGSLLWEGGGAFDASWYGAWRRDGPSLRIEFSRVSASRSGALTLVIDAENGAIVPVAWRLSRRSAISNVIQDLCERERTTERQIGRVSAVGEMHYRDDESFQAIRAWMFVHGLRGVVWTDLPSNFAEKIGRPFSIANAMAYLQSLEGESKKTALEYIERAPVFVRTPLRAALATSVTASRTA
jgi:cation transport regulator ChaC